MCSTRHATCRPPRRPLRAGGAPCVCRATRVREHEPPAPDHSGPSVPPAGVRVTECRAGAGQRARAGVIFPRATTVGPVCVHASPLRSKPVRSVYGCVAPVSVPPAHGALCARAARA
eukprot:5884889-Pleurochrysis_carterae.AAC.1